VLLLIVVEVRQARMGFPFLRIIEIKIYQINFDSQSQDIKPRSTIHNKEYHLKSTALHITISISSFTA
jgi:hypothetical protein